MAPSTKTDLGRRDMANILILNENDFSNAINLNNNNVGSVSIPNQNLNSEQSSRHPRNNKSKFDIYLPNI